MANKVTNVQYYGDEEEKFHIQDSNHTGISSALDSSSIIFSQVEPSYLNSSSIIFSQNDPSYSTILQSHIHNLRFRNPWTPKPQLIVTPFLASHVQEAVKWAKKQRGKVQMRIRSGGHDYEGLSYSSKSNTPFFILDMFNLRSIDIDIDTETAWVGAGATIGELVYAIAKHSKVHGFPAGVCPSVGVGGHFSGGGYGNMMRKYGLTIDNVIDAVIVDASGRVLNRESMGEDLFWAVRGGGAGFGVVISYKIKVVRVPQQVTVFQVSKTLEENAIDAVLQWQEIASVIDRDLFLRLMIDVTDGVMQGQKTLRATFVALFLGDSEKLMPMLSKNFPTLGLKESDCHQVTWIQSVLFWADIPIDSPLEVLLQKAPTTLSYHTRKSDYVTQPITKEGFECIAKKVIELETPGFIFNPYGGKMSEISASETAFPHRKGNLYKIQYLANWKEEGKDKEGYYMNLVRKLYSYMTPFVSKGPRQAYYNYRDLDLGINRHGRSSYMDGMKYGIPYFKENFGMLVKIKSKFDPENLFHNEQSIPNLCI